MRSRALGTLIHTHANTDHASEALVELYCLPTREVTGLIEGALCEEVVVPRVMVVVVRGNQRPDDLVVSWVRPQEGTAARRVHPLVEIACKVHVFLFNTMVRILDPCGKRTRLCFHYHRSRGGMRGSYIWVCLYICLYVCPDA